MIEGLKSLARRSPLAIKTKRLFARPKAQMAEASILNRLIGRYSPPKLFVEFGFSGWEYNCAELTDWEGLLLDGDPYNARVAQAILPERIRSEQLWITLESLSCVPKFVAGRELGILSIDVDGNDYWFLRKLIPLRPAIISVEYNSIFGLRPLTVPYEEDFDRRKKHPDWVYFGASLSALYLLAEENDYSLVEVTPNGVNAFFVRNDILREGDTVLTPKEAFREKVVPEASRIAYQWSNVEGMPFVDVTTL